MTVNINAANISSVQLAAAQTPSAPNSGFVRLHHNANSRLAMRPATGNVVEFLGNTSGSGAGITFPATQSPSTDVNTLDDYEEGTWTPDIRSSAGTGTASYSEAVGTYTKIGRLVMASALVSWSGHAQSGGNLRIGNFPFNPSSTDNAAAIGYFHNVGLATNNVVTALIPSGSNQMIFYQYPITGGAASLVGMDIAGSIYVTITYTA